MMMFLFAFGTLKRGFPLHCRGLGDAPYLGQYRTVERFPMLIAGPWFAPMMLDEPGCGLPVMGELYEIDETRLAQIDALESIGIPGNDRRLVEVEPIDGGARRRAFAYVKARILADPAHSGWLDDYQDDRFIPPERREG